VLQRATGRTEMIGPMEQAFMDIACLDQDIREGITTHQELNPTNMLSLIANMTPFSDQNQSPRNMYQCQMGKQVSSEHETSVSRPQESFTAPCALVHSDHGNSSTLSTVSSRQQIVSPPDTTSPNCANCHAW
jgi:DNA-directed RNA polymerase beta subunit